MPAFDGWHLPGLHTDELAFDTYRFGDIALRAPVLTRDQLQRAIAHVTDARQSLLATMRVHELAAAIATAAARLGDSATPEGAAARTLLPAVTGYSQATIDEVLAHLIDDLGIDSLRTLLAAELGGPDMLDAPQRDALTQRYVLARGPRLAFQVFSGNVPGIAVSALARCLLVKGATLGKTASGEPVLPILFARALARVAPALADCMAVTYWPGGSTDIESVAIDQAETVIVYGSEDTVKSIRARVGTGTRLIVHGPGMSIGFVSRTASVDIAEAIARATAAYDQQGCVSPHVVYVEKGGALHARDLARAVADRLAELAVRIPRRKLTVSEATAVRAVRTQTEFRTIAGSDVELFASEDTSYTVIYDSEPSLVASCLNRTLYIKPVDNLRHLASLLASHRGILQSAALAGFTTQQARDIAMLFSECDIKRITSFEDLPWPPMWWHHDGRGPLRELLTWHDVEF